MKSPFFLRIILSVLFFGSICAAILSCGDDEKPLNKTLFTVSIPAGSLDRQEEIWFFLTSPQGELLGIQEAIDGLNMVFERPSGFKGNKFTVHKLAYELGEDESYADFTFNSYTGISEGEIRLPVIDINVQDEVGEYHFNVTGVPSGYNPIVIAPYMYGASFHGSAGNWTGSASLLQNNIPIMCWWQDHNDRTKIPRFSFTNSAMTDETLTTTFTNLTVASETTFDFGRTVGRAEFTVRPHIPGSGFIGPFEYFNRTNVASVKLYHPGSTFESYNAWIRLTEGSQSQTAHTIGALPTTVKPLSATINSFSATQEQLTVETTGTYDYLYAYGFTEWYTGERENWLMWFVYMDDATQKTFNIPPFPEVLTERYPELLTATKNFYAVLINDADNVDGYEEYLQSTWGTTSFPMFSESLSRYRNFSLGGRMPSEQKLRIKKSQ